MPDFGYMVSLANQLVDNYDNSIYLSDKTINKVGKTNMNKFGIQVKEFHASTTTFVAY